MKRPCKHSLWEGWSQDPRNAICISEMFFSVKADARRRIELSLRKVGMFELCYIVALLFHCKACVAKCALSIVRRDYILFSGTVPKLCVYG